MADYRKMYIYLFNAVTDAIRQLEARNYGESEEMLKKAQCYTEEVYIAECEEEK